MVMWADFTSVQKPFAALLNDDVVEYAIKDPVTANFNDLLEDAVAKMGENKIWDLPVVEGGKLRGLLHLHPAINELIR